MLINYLGNYPGNIQHISKKVNKKIKKIKNVMIEKIYRIVSFQTNLKSVSGEILGHDQPGIFIG